MKEFIKRRRLVPLAAWLAVYMALFVYQEIFEPEQVTIISCWLDELIPHVPAFVYPYLSWFPYIVVCAVLALRNLDDKDYRKAVLILVTGMNIFLLITYVWPTGLDFRESITYDTSTLSGWLMKFVQTVDTPKGVFPSMHVFVTLVLQYTLELQKEKLPGWGVFTGRCFAAAIILSTMFTKQHSALDVIAAIFMFAALSWAFEAALSGRGEKVRFRKEQVE